MSFNTPNLPTELFDAKLLGFDTETTGVNPRQDRLVTAALISREPGREDEQRLWLADPGVEIPEAAQRVHGISTEKARAEGLDLRIVLEQVAAGIVEGWRQGAILVGFNISFDLQILHFGLERLGLPTLIDRAGGFGPIADPLVLDRKFDRYRRGKRTLTDLCTVYDLGTGRDFHQADADVTATLDLFQAQLRRYPTLAGFSAAQLNEEQALAHEQWATSFNDWLRSKGRVADVSETWPL
ncbi:hypothetical protein BSR28_00340 [Boudabousia liubingyangii]|uniref:exonuclease domain-containing protein n=1 Tax=Boudabousia liubingyangii TaxID=1921764 RepID=UPI00093B1EBB|nr:exonuclease domain-containing protein [Boudabousia liubingyangii]OKL48570.1 hypothetical protein BSR28_00340 [Boudabousia liubingyangii]